MFNLSRFHCQTEWLIATIGWKKTTTCASLRLDVLIKEMYQVSRQQALDLIKKGWVKVNFQKIEQPSYFLEERDMVSVRGKGRTRLTEIQGKTKKGQIKNHFRKIIIKMQDFFVFLSNMYGTIVKSTDLNEGGGRCAINTIGYS